MPGGVDPLYQQQQQQYFHSQGLELAKKAQREQKTARVKPRVILIVLLAFVLAGAAFFVLGGGLSRSVGFHVAADGVLYRLDLGRSVVSREEGFEPAGTLVPNEDPANSAQNFATDWHVAAEVYVNPLDRSRIYVRWQGHYLLCKRERRPLP